MNKNENRTEQSGSQYKIFTPDIMDQWLQSSLVFQMFRVFSFLGPIILIEVPCGLPQSLHKKCYYILPRILDVLGSVLDSRPDYPDRGFSCFTPVSPQKCCYILPRIRDILGSVFESRAEYPDRSLYSEMLLYKTTTYFRPFSIHLRQSHLSYDETLQNQ